MGLKESERQYRDKIQIDGRELPGIYSDSQRSFSLMDAGDVESIVGYFLLRKSLYPQEPKERKGVQINGVPRLVKTVTDDRVAWKIGVESAGK